MHSRLRKHAAYSALLRQMAEQEEMEKNAISISGGIQAAKTIGLGAARIGLAPLRWAGSLAAAPLKAGAGATGTAAKGLAGVIARNPMKSLVGALTIGGAAGSMAQSRAGFRTAAELGQSTAATPIPGVTPGVPIQ